ncbi:hypothetical protein HMF8227_02544 [Saliniradius amylolyticus]|uniref:Uncharacterized protein n=2 Tax=Saliniradius amylolyticus TaxID=2183582 RepID=A0A2S2E5R4_9ALTE|nr:hypothetical protein HMF8227_02544 [Saliniradius amylolyticus]
MTLEVVSCSGGTNDYPRMDSVASAKEKLIITPVEQPTTEEITKEEPSSTPNKQHLPEDITQAVEDAKGLISGLSEASSPAQYLEVRKELHKLSRDEYHHVMKWLIIESNKGNINFDIAFLN